ncbi:MAG TPA: VCBS repeat-containing protein, partial [Balneolales bacterium]|nr:VCBS repeat-containing protein [Balneolales bacterium]
IPTVYLPDSTGVYKEYPSQGRDDLFRELLMIGKKYPSYSSFGKATIHDLFTQDELKGALIYHADNLQSCYIENMGNGKFTMKPLPVQAQFAPVFGMTTGDFNNDGNLDVLLNGNESGIEPQIGNYDAFNGLLLEGDGKGDFKPVSLKHSGIYIPGDGKAMVKVAGADGSELMVASQNQGPLKIFRDREKGAIVPLHPNDAYAILHLDNGKTRKQEFYYGSSFLSASGRFMRLSRHVTSVDVYDFMGNKRSIPVK